MNEFINKLISRLEEAKDRAKRHYNYGDLTAYRYAIEIVNQLAEEYADVKNSLTTDGWIPCSERVPEEPGDYLVQIDGTRMMIGHWNDGVFRFNSWFIASDRIIAWRPLPTPYRPEGE